MKHKFLLLYSWFVRTILFFAPDIPFIMRFRGWLYGLGMKKKGKNFQIPHSVILNTIELLSVGDNVFVGNFCSFILNGEILIGDNVLIGPNCVLSSGNHVFSNDSFRFGKSAKQKIIIENDCWIAANCTIVGNTKLPKKSILAAGAVLTKIQTQEESIYGGVPAKLIKEIEQ